MTDRKLAAIERKQMGYVLWWCAVCIVLVMILGGCSLLPLTAKDKIASGVQSYCEKMSYAERSMLRTEVNTLIFPNSVKVTCEGDPQ